MSAEGVQGALALGDELRAAGSTAALEAYAKVEPRAIASDATRLEWVMEHARESLDEAFTPLFEYVVAELDGVPRRQALQLLGSGCWYRGEMARAERYWLQGAAEGRELADGHWVTCVLNVALLFMARGRTFESLVFSGRAKRAARKLGDENLFALSSARRGMGLVRVGELERAQVELDIAKKAMPSLEPGQRRQLLRSISTLWRARLQRARGDIEGALELLREHISATESLPRVRRESVMFEAVCDRIQLELEVMPERRAKLLEEIEAVPRTLGLRPEWLDSWRLRLLEVRLRHAILEGRDAAIGIELGREVLDLLPGELSHDYLIGRASELGRIFSEELDSEEDARRAYGLAASVSLRRIVELNRVTAELPELSDATPEDWEVLDSLRHSMRQRHAALFDAIREQWSAGHPSVELLRDGTSDVKACAWCHRILSSDGRWLPVAQFLPSELDLPSARAEEQLEFEVTHGICPSCSERLLS